MRSLIFRLRRRRGGAEAEGYAAQLCPPPPGPSGSVYCAATWRTPLHAGHISFLPVPEHTWRKFVAGG
ncbi:Hypothetical protein NTJ_13977 [Nesidiocoris tenuis]|uniref:Uncharacterized protein n=1 Tax=Nesidiocoris tenuis TaxID=355587 RepID=A0ABN7BD88_9HEMI|nr:Hypothetical protein NTJ_13977 [Nesidiocoris tenuis]